MTSFLRDNPTRRIVSSREQKPKRLYVVIGALVTLSFLLFGRHFLSASLVSAVRPLWALEDAAQSLVAPVTSAWASKMELTLENSRLAQETGAKDLEIQRLTKLLDDYTDIKALFGEKDRARQDPAGRGRLATVFERPPVSPFDTLIVSTGEHDAKNKYLVYAPGDVIIGEVAEVLPNSSKVLLYSSPGHEIGAFIKNVGPIKLTGTGNGNFVGELPKNQSIPQGTVITVEEEGGIIARVGTTTVPDGSATQKVYARTPANIQALTWVYIVSHE